MARIIFSTFISSCVRTARADAASFEKIKRERGLCGKRLVGHCNKNKKRPNLQQRVMY